MLERKMPVLERREEKRRGKEESWGEGEERKTKQRKPSERLGSGLPPRRKPVETTQTT